MKFFSCQFFIGIGLVEGFSEQEGLNMRTVQVETTPEIDLGYKGAVIINWYQGGWSNQGTNKCTDFEGRQDFSARKSENSSAPRVPINNDRSLIKTELFVSVSVCVCVGGVVRPTLYTTL